MDTLDELGLSSVEPERLRPISRKEYDQMVEHGIVQEDEKVELLRGMLVTMSPQGWEHGEVIAWLTEKLILALQGRFAVRPQLPFAADDWSEPEPDIAIAEKDPTRRDHPSTLLLLIEVANTSLRKDRRAKLRIYADAGVPEYWIVDITTMTVEVFTEPAAGKYTTSRVLRDGDVLRPTRVPGIEIAVSDLPR